ncbi:MAG: UDP-N-acetylglucosamine 1-carboxyvinyltransferase [Victivallales bacterium]|nr:UDP-N-acetylglucosamine 1-carboxyvinyltransferase [Victivallales bacterium]
MRSIRIEGGSKTDGVIRLGGNKNAALPMLVASILTKDEVILHNVPKIVDVEQMLEIARALGVQVSWEGDTLVLCAKDVTGTVLPSELCRRIRTSLLFAGPLTARCGSARLAPPGGDVIGRRRLDGHFYGLQKLGVKIEATPYVFSFSRDKRLHGSEIFLDEASVTATEHILLTAVLSSGTTIIRNAACEPHVSQLAQLLNAMGARISGIESNILVVEGVSKLHGAEMTIGSDHVEAASFLSLCAVTGGQIELQGDIQPRHYWMTRRVFERFSLHFTLKPNLISMKVRSAPRLVKDLGNAIPVIADGPWPQFPSDMMSCLVVVATQARGTSLFFEKMFESRLYFVDKLVAMGANAVVCDPHRVVISGPVRLHGIEMSSPDIRAGMAMVVAAACARGTSVIYNAEMIYRGYSELVPKLNALGIQAQELEL